MKIIVLGGAGDMGSCTVEDLARTPGVAQVTIADRNQAGAEALRAKLKGSGAAAAVELCAVDAMDHGSMVRAMSGHDAAASALGPFWKFEPRMIKAAIEARVPYASICDDWIACERVLAELDGPARAAGVTCVTGIGASPGITNLLAAFLGEGMESVRRVDVSCYQPWTAGGGEAVLRHLLFIITGEIGAFQGGKAQRVKACTVKQAVEVPHYGLRTLYNLGHPEPVSLPRHFPGCEAVNFFMGFGGGMGVLAAVGRSGIFAREGAVNAVVKLATPLERHFAGTDPGLSAIRVDVWGRSGGREVHEMVCGTGAMREGTGLPLAAAVVQLANGTVRSSTGGGVFPPEAVIDIRSYIGAMREKGITGYRDLACTEVFGL